MADFQFSNEIDARQLQPGDHIYCYRSRRLYAHHGIFVGDNRVIHYVGNKGGSGVSPCEECCTGVSRVNGVVRTCLSCFSKGAPLRLCRYGVGNFTFRFSKGGSCNVLQADEAELVISRAYEKLQHGFDNYDLLRNNCEVFCIHCKTGAIPVPPGGAGSFTSFFCSQCNICLGSAIPLSKVVRRDGKLFYRNEILRCARCKVPASIPATSLQAPDPIVGILLLFHTAPIPIIALTSAVWSPAPWILMPALMPALTHALWFKLMASGRINGFKVFQESALQ